MIRRATSSMVRYRTPARIDPLEWLYPAPGGIRCDFAVPPCAVERRLQDGQNSVCGRFSRRRAFRMVRRFLEPLFLARLVLMRAGAFETLPAMF